MQGADLLIVYLYSYFPALVLGGFFWWMDRFERESLFLVVAAFCWGGFGALILSFFWNTFFSIALQVYQMGSYDANDIVSAVIVAPFVEELMKGCVILLLLRLNKVDNMTDGLLLGLIIGLGFAASENVFYAVDRVYPVSGELAMWYNLWFREIHTTLLHGSATAVWGALIGYSRGVKGAPKGFLIVNGFLLAMVTHGFWNFLASYVNSVRTEMNVIEVVMKMELALIFGLLVGMYFISLKLQSKMIIEELTEEHNKGVLPFEHIGFFASLIRHPKRYNLPKTIKADQYAQLGVKLAFRKSEYRKNPSEVLATEIESLRQKVKIASGYQPDSLQLIYGRST